MRALRSALFWDITQRMVEIPYRRRFPSSRVNGRLSRNVGKEVPIYARNVPEERRSHLLRGGNLKSRKCVSFRMSSLLRDETEGKAVFNIVPGSQLASTPKILHDINLIVLPDRRLSPFLVMRLHEIDF